METFCQIQAPGQFQEVYGSMLKGKKTRKPNKTNNSFYLTQDLIQISALKLIFHLRKHSAHRNSSLIINFPLAMLPSPPSNNYCYNKQGVYKVFPKYSSFSRRQ